MFGPSAGEIQDMALDMATNHLALVLVLCDKGIITPEEYAAARTRATHICEQELAKVKAEAQAEYDKELGDQS